MSAWTAPTRGELLAHGRSLRRESGYSHRGEHWTRKRPSFGSGYVLGLVSGLLAAVVLLEPWLRIGGWK